VRIFALIALCAAPLFARDKSDVIFVKNSDRITCEIAGFDLDILPALA